MRVTNRVLAFLLSAALIVLGVLVVVEVIAALTGHDWALVDWPRTYNWLQRTRWNAGSVRVAAYLTAIVGLVLLLAQLKRRRAARLPAASEQSGFDSAYTRRGVAATVRSAVADVDGVRSARATVGRRKVRVVADAGTAEPGVVDALTSAVTQRAQQRLDALRLDPAPSLSVRVSSGSH